MTFESYRQKMLRIKQRKKRIKAWELAHPVTVVEGDPINPELTIPTIGI
jgi:hypothetical protein